MNQDITLTLTGVEAGHHMLKYYATSQRRHAVCAGCAEPDAEEKPRRTTAPVSMITSSDNIASNKAGTVVLQPKDGKTYQCATFLPVQRLLRAVEQYATQFEPGTGSH